MSKGFFHRIKVDNEYIETFTDVAYPDRLTYAVTYTQSKVWALRIKDADLQDFTDMLGYFGFNLDLVSFEPVGYQGVARIYEPYFFPLWIQDTG